MASQASVQECEAYIEQHGIQAILKECIAKICQERPAKPYKWLREYFVSLANVSFDKSYVGRNHGTCTNPLLNHNPDPTLSINLGVVHV